MRGRQQTGDLRLLRTAGLDGFFAFGNGGGEIYEVVIREVLDFMNQGGQRKLEFPEGGILFLAGGGGDDGA